MAFPSELPAMRRLCLPAPNPFVTAFAWAGMSYAVATAILHAPMAWHLVPSDALSLVLGSLSSSVLGLIVMASLVPALIIAAMLRQSPTAWSESRLAVAYLSMVGLVLAFQCVGADPSSYSAMNCCGTRGPG